MVVQNEVEWLLGIIKTNYPAAEWPDDLLRRNGNDSYNLETDERDVGVQPERWNTIEVSDGSKQQELYGTSPQYRVQTTIDVTIQAAHVQEGGHIADDNAWKQLVAYVKHAINSEITYPDVQSGREDIDYVEYLDLRIPDDNDLSSGDKDYYHREITVEMRGNAETP